MNLITTSINFFRNNNSMCPKLLEKFWVVEDLKAWKNDWKHVRQSNLAVPWKTVKSLNSITVRNSIKNVIMNYSFRIWNEWTAHFHLMIRSHYKAYIVYKKLSIICDFTLQWMIQSLVFWQHWEDSWSV